MKRVTLNRPSSVAKRTHGFWCAAVVLAAGAVLRARRAKGRHRLSKASDLVGVAGEASAREARLRQAETMRQFSARRVLRSGAFDPCASPPRGGCRETRSGGSQKIARLAVLRNTVKRMACEIFRRRRSELPPSDLVLRLAQTGEQGIRQVTSGAISEALLENCSFSHEEPHARKYCWHRSAPTS